MYDDEVFFMTFGKIPIPTSLFCIKEKKKLIKYEGLSNKSIFRLIDAPLMF